MRYGTFLGLLVAGLLAQPAFANSTPHYSLSIVEGVTTLPEYSVENTSAGTPNKQEAVVKIFHNGAEVAKSKGEGGAWMSKVPTVGDTVTLESPAGTVIGSVAYDGLPTIDPTVCAGSANFSGQRSEGEEVEGKYVSLRVHTTPYVTEKEEFGFGHAQVTTLAGKTYSGSFLSALIAGQTVSAVESIKIPIAGGAVFDYSSESVRPVGGCPSPPAPISIPAPILPPAIQGAIVKFVTSTIHKLLKFGLSDQVSINQPGTVTQDLYLQGGALPALAASRHKHRKLPPALLLARGAATAAVAGHVTVHLKLTARGRHRLRTARSLKAVLVTTLRTAGGHALSLPRRSVLLHR
jgi:hypothetical protein